MGERGLPDAAPDGPARSVAVDAGKLSIVLSEVDLESESGRDAFYSTVTERRTARVPPLLLSPEANSRRAIWLPSGHRTAAKPKLYLGSMNGFLKDGPAAGQAVEAGDPPVRRGVIVAGEGTFGEEAYRYYLSAVDSTRAVYTYGGKVLWPPEANPHVRMTAEPAESR